MQLSPTPPRGHQRPAILPTPQAAIYLRPCPDPPWPSLAVSGSNNAPDEEKGAIFFQRLGKDQKLHPCVSPLPPVSLASKNRPHNGFLETVHLVVVKANTQEYAACCYKSPLWFMRQHCKLDHCEDLSLIDLSMLNHMALLTTTLPLRLTNLQAKSVVHLLLENSVLLRKKTKSYIEPSYSII